MPRHELFFIPSLFFCLNSPPNSLPTSQVKCCDSFRKLLKQLSLSVFNARNHGLPPRAACSNSVQSTTTQEQQEDYILAFIVMRSVTETCNFQSRVAAFDFEHDNNFYIKGGGGHWHRLIYMCAKKKERNSFVSSPSKRGEKWYLSFSTLMRSGQRRQ